MSFDKIKKIIREHLAKKAEDNMYSKKVENLMNNLESKYPIDLFIYYNKFANTIILSQIVVDQLKRESGVGTKVMKEICDFADENNLRIALTPSPDFGGSKNRLIKFYKSLGFKNYKGFEFRETMVREPKS